VSTSTGSMPATASAANSHCWAYVTRSRRRWDFLPPSEHYLPRTTSATRLRGCDVQSIQNRIVEIPPAHPWRGGIPFRGAVLPLHIGRVGPALDAGAGVADG